MWAANLQGKPRCRANLNGTDLLPRFAAAAPQGTTVFCSGAEGVASTAGVLPRFAHLRFVGHSHGYLSEATRQSYRSAGTAASADRAYRDRQSAAVEFIDRHLTTPGCAERCGLPSVVSSIITAERCGGRRLCYGGRDSNGCISSRSSRTN